VCVGNQLGWLPTAPPDRPPGRATDRFVRQAKRYSIATFLPSTWPPGRSFKGQKRHRTYRATRQTILRGLRGKRLAPSASARRTSKPLSERDPVRDKVVLFNHFIRTDALGGRECVPSSGLQVDDQLDLSCMLHRKVGRLLALENPPRVDVPPRGTSFRLHSSSSLITSSNLVVSLDQLLSRLAPCRLPVDRSRRGSGIARCFIKH
jgi:hypothetical protein